MGRKWRGAFTAALLSALVVVPAAQADAAEACTWTAASWQMPSGADNSIVHGYDGRRYAVGNTSRMIKVFNIWQYTDKRAVLWDNGQIALRLTSETAVMSDVNAAGLIVGSEKVNERTVAATFNGVGAATVLPGSATWDSYWATHVTSAGDIVGQAVTGERRTVVSWSSTAPGTYRELPIAGVDDARPQGVDDQLRIIASAPSTNGGGYVRDTDGTWRVLAHPASGWSRPWAIRGGRVVGLTDIYPYFTVTEWNARGTLVRTYPEGSVALRAIGGNGTVGGDARVGDETRTVLWRDGVVSDQLPSVSSQFQLTEISDDERTLVGVEGIWPHYRPVHYRCS